MRVPSGSTLAPTIVYVGELAGNTAMAALFLPVTGAAALAVGTEPVSFLLPVVLAASVGFMLPVATGTSTATQLESPSCRATRSRRGVSPSSQISNDCTFSTTVSATALLIRVTASISEGSTGVPSCASAGTAKVMAQASGPSFLAVLILLPFLKGRARERVVDGIRLVDVHDAQAFIADSLCADLTRKALPGGRGSTRPTRAAEFAVI